jgi:hypothetical protein
MQKRYVVEESVLILQIYTFLDMVYPCAMYLSG